MRVTTRLRVVSAAMIAALVILIPFVVWSLHEAASARGDFMLADEVLSSFFERTFLRDQYFLYGEARTHRQWEENKQQSDKLLRQARLQFERDEDKAAVDGLIRSIEESAAIFRRVVAIRSALRAAPPDKDSAVREELDKRLSSQMLLKSASIREDVIGLRDESAQRVDAANRRLAVAVSLLAGLLAIFTLSVAISLVQLIGKRLAPLHSGMKTIADGDLAHRIDSAGMDEFSELAEAVNGMTDRLVAEISAHKLADDLIQLQGLIFQSLSEGIAMVRVRDGTIVFANSPFEKLFGYAPNELLGKHVSEINGPGTSSAEAVAETIIAELGRTGVWHGEVQNLRKDGSLFWCSATVTTFDHPQLGQVWVSVHEDITERKQAEMELDKHRHHLEQLVSMRTAELAAAKDAAETANVAKSVFLANMSHELRTPMNGVMGMIDLVLRRAVDPQQIDWLNKSKASARHLMAIINDILDISKIESSRMVLEEHSFSLAQTLADVLQMQEAAAVLKGLRLSSEIAATLPDRLCGDAMRLKQILLNFVGNAIKFSERGQITIRARAVEDAGDSLLLRIEVADQGIGISPEQQERLFHAFAQVDGSIKRKYGGSGLGLVISKRLAMLMGGDVGVESAAGVGSTFWATLRLKRSAEASDGEAELGVDAETAIRTTYGERRVLVVDDEAMNREVAQLQLEGADLVVDTAEDGAEAIALAMASRYSAILMDMQMPNVDGLEATRKIRQIPGHQQTPIIAMTANAFAEDRARCLEAGMNDFLIKPFTPDGLFAALLRAFGQVKEGLH